MYERLPQELKDHALFCGWRYEQRDGGKKKVPKTAAGRNADVSRPSDFCGFDEIVGSAGGFDGIGISVTGGIVAIDIDHSVTGGELSGLAAVVEKARSYTEVSPSGEGIRIIGKANGFAYDRERYYVNNRKLGLEVYVPGGKGRFVTVTGNAVRDWPLRDISDVLPGILEEYMLRPVQQRPGDRADAPGSLLTDEEVVAKASSASNGGKFLALYGGDTGGYPSHSEADLALMTMLAFWCGGDGEQMDRVFRGSGLYRQKWERADYREATISRAVSGASSFYAPPERAPAEEDFREPDGGPVPLGGMPVPAFPVDALPEDIRDYVLAVAESTQTPVDVAACASLSVLSIGNQGKYEVRPKPDWAEPVNTFIAVFMPPSERKSAVCSMMGRPMDEHEKEWNREHAAEIDFGRAQRSVLERRLKSAEEQTSKGKAEMEDVRRASEELSAFREVKPLRYYADDVTTEKLVKMLSDNGGRAAIFSPEGGIFDLLKGMYTRYVNIDVFLKGYSGDPIRVDRIGRESDVIYDPALTVMLMAQPSVLAGVMEDGNFRGRGLTARFLYSIPESNVGRRKYRSAPVPEEAYRRYDRCIRGMLTEEQDGAPVAVTLSPEADRLLGAFAEELETKLKDEYAGIADWAGKLVGNTARIAALLCRAGRPAPHGFLDGGDPPVISGAEMADAIRIARYFTGHAKAAFSLLGADEGLKDCRYVLAAIRKAGLSEVSRRDVMRLCRALRTRDAVQAVLDRLAEYGYLSEKEPARQPGRGRSPSPVYLVNACVFEGE